MKNAWGVCALPLLFWGAGCSTTAPVLVEPRAPSPGDIRTQGGAAVNAPIAGDTRALSEARTILSKPNASADSSTLAAIDPGTAVVLAARPGVAPVVRASAGVGPNVELGIRYAGRDVGASLRYFLVESRTETGGATTLSVGLDAKTVLFGRADDGYAPGMAIESVRGYGAAIPLVAAFQADAGLLFGYFAATIGFDRVTALVAYPGLGPPSAPTPPEKRNDLHLRAAAVNRVWGAATVGVGLGFRRVHVIMELGIQRDSLDAKLDEASAHVTLYSLTPAFAFSTSF